MASTPSAGVFAPEVLALPSGYTGLPRDVVRASQRQRLLHGVTTTVAAKGFAPATIGDIASAAGVSKKTFYEHFDDKLACFLAAYDHGRTALLAAIDDAARDAVAAGAGAVEQLRSANRAYLRFLLAEQSYARTFFLEITAVGPEGVARHQECRDQFAASLRRWHTRARREHPDWPRARTLAYEAATGAAHELALARIATGRAQELPKLEGDLLDVQLAVLGVPRVT